jgi:predicted TIM-barrel fold metal-dependent hydrolase
MPIVDVHAHLPPGANAAPRLLELMDRLEIARAALIPGGTVSPDALSRNIAFGGGVDVTPDNARVLEACARSAGRLCAFYFANPYQGAAPYLREGRAYAGLKLGPAVHGVAFDDAHVLELVAAAADFGHPVYLHCLARPGFTVADARALADRFASVPIIVGHAAGGHCEFHAIETLASAPNAYIEVSGGFVSFVDACVRRLGASRVLFGSEYPLQHPAAELAKIRCLELSSEELRLILGDNATRLMGQKAS